MTAKAGPGGASPTRVRSRSTGTPAFRRWSAGPINRYHVLVVPRRHVEHLAEVPSEMLAEVVRVAQRVSAAIAAVARPDAITLLSDDDLTDAGFNEVAH